jgi:hypothetical protein
MMQDEGGPPDPSGHARAYVWTDAVLRALRRALEAEGFTEILPAILSSRFEPGARHSVAVLGRRRLPKVRDAQAADGAGVEVSGHRAKERTRIQSGGFGVGLERLVRFCCAARSVLDVRRRHDSGPNAGIELES